MDPKKQVVATPSPAEQSDPALESGATISYAKVLSLLSLPTVVIAWIGIFFSSLVSFLDNVASNTLFIYALSEFQSLSLEGGLMTINSVVGIALQGFLVCLINCIDISYVFSAGIIILVLGIVVNASASSGQALLGGNAIFAVGGFACRFVLTVVAAELSSLRYRALAIAAANVAAVASLLGGGKITENLLADLGWRWGFGIWAIVVPVASLPLLIVLFIKRREFRQTNIVSDNAAPRSFWDLLSEQDIIGCLLLAGGVAALLLPIPLETDGVSAYSRARVVAPTVLGFVLCIVFVIWEAKFAKNPVIAGRILRNRRALGPFMTVWFVYCSVSVTLPYFFSYLVVASNLSVSHATYIAQSLSIVSSVVAVAIGWLVAIFKRGKWIFVSTAAIFLLGMGLLYGFHDPMTQRGTLVGAVVLAGIGLGGNSGNAFALVQSVLEPRDIPAITGLLFIFANVGGAIGASISGAIWTSHLPEVLERTLPDELAPQATMIMQSVIVSQSFALGSPIRTIIIDAYDETFTILLLIGLVLASVAFLLTFLAADVYLGIDEQQQEIALDDTKVDDK